MIQLFSEDCVTLTLAVQQGLFDATIEFIGAIGPQTSLRVLRIDALQDIPSVESSEFIILGAVPLII